MNWNLETSDSNNKNIWPNRKDGKREGFGILNFEFGRYEGEWKNDRYHGADQL